MTIHAGQTPLADTAARAHLPTDILLGTLVLGQQNDREDRYEVVGAFITDAIAQAWIPSPVYAIQGLLPRHLLPLTSLSFHRALVPRGHRGCTSREPGAVTLLPLILC